MSDNQFVTKSPRWQNDDVITESELNRIETNLDYLKEQVDTFNDTGIGNFSEILNNKADASALQTLQGSVETLTSQLSGKANVSDLNGKASQSAVDNLTTLVNSKASQSAVDNLNSQVGGLATTVTSHASAVSEVNSAHRNGVTNDTLSQRFSAIESNITAIESTIGSSSSGSLASRVTAVEGAIGNGYDSEHTVATAISSINSALNDKANASEVTAALASKASTSDVEDLDTRLDAVDGGSALTGSTLAARVGVVESSLTGVGGIDARLDAIDGGSALDTTNGTLAARITTVEGIASTALQASDIATLNSDVAALKGKDTIVMTVAAFEDLDAASNSTNKEADYIVGPYANEDNIYKYYRIISNQKTLISGASSNNGGGTGNSNALCFIFK